MATARAYKRPEIKLRDSEQLKNFRHIEERNGTGYFRLRDIVICRLTAETFSWPERRPYYHIAGFYGGNSPSPNLIQIRRSVPGKHTVHLTVRPSDILVLQRVPRLGF